MLFFAYNEYLDKKLMKSVCPQSVPKQTAYLSNHQLFFTGWARKWRGGTASIKGMSGSRVPGALYEVPESCQRRLDKEMGCPALYERVNIKVNIEDGGQIEVFSYAGKRQTDETKPSAEYAALLKRGYIDWGII